MENQQTKLNPPEDDLDKVTFADDRVGGLKDIAERLTKYIDRLQSGAVITINAPWGGGKSWFGHAWNNELQNSEHKDKYATIFIDAFRQDYLEDPLLLITTEFKKIFKKTSSQRSFFRHFYKKYFMPYQKKWFLKLENCFL